MSVKPLSLTPHKLVSSELLKPIDPLEDQFGPVAGLLVNLSDFSDLPGMGCSASTWSHKHTDWLIFFFKAVVQKLPLVSLVTVCQLTLTLAKFWDRWQQMKPNRSHQRSVVGGAWHSQLGTWSPEVEHRCEWGHGVCVPRPQRGKWWRMQEQRYTAKAKKIEAISRGQQVCQAEAPCPR